MQQANAWPEVLGALAERQDLTIGQAAWALEQIMRGSAPEAAVGGLLVGLEAKGVTVPELIGFRDAALAAAVPLPGGSEMLDIVGTGGDRHKTVNISTMAAIVAAAAGVPVLKHGNRAVSSKSGSGDVLQELGLVPAREDAHLVREIFDEAGIAFAHAARFHPGFKHVAPVRAALGIPTLFNVLGPLLHPARPEASALGVANAAMIDKFVGVFKTRGATALVFRGEDGLDEVTTTGYTHFYQVSRGDVGEYTLDARELGIPRATLDDLRGGSPAENAEVVRRVMAGEQGPVRDIVLLNAAVGITAWRLHTNPEQITEPLLERIRVALADATHAVDSGEAEATLRRWQTAVAARG